MPEEKKGFDVFGLGELSSSSLELIKLVYPDLFQPGIKKIGEGVKTIVEFCCTPLLILKLGSEAANLLFRKRSKQITDRLEKIPDDKIVTPPRELGTKLFDHIVQTSDEKLSEMFVELLANACHKDRVPLIHPRYAVVLKQISCDEAHLIKYIKENLFFQSLFLAHNTHLVTETRRELFYIPDSLGDKLLISKSIGIYMNNLCYLGIIHRTRANRIPELGNYNVWESYEKYIWLKTFENQYPELYQEVKSSYELLSASNYRHLDVDKQLFGQGHYDSVPELGPRQFSLYQIRDIGEVYILTEFGKGLVEQVYS